MMIELKELPTRWAELERQLHAGVGVTLTSAGATVGTVIPQPSVPVRPPRKSNLHPGAFQPTPDFDDPLPDEFWLGGNP